ncbi:hypothetical protein [Microtetraspora malaysiensis]
MVNLIAYLAALTSWAADHGIGPDTADRYVLSLPCCAKRSD